MREVLSFHDEEGNTLGGAGGKEIEEGGGMQAGGMREEGGARECGSF